MRRQRGKLHGKGAEMIPSCKIFREGRLPLPKGSGGTSRGRAGDLCSDWWGSCATSGNSVNLSGPRKVIHMPVLLVSVNCCDVPL